MYWFQLAQEKVQDKTCSMLTLFVNTLNTVCMCFAVLHVFGCKMRGP